MFGIFIAVALSDVLIFTFAICCQFCPMWSISVNWGSGIAQYVNTVGPFGSKHKIIQLEELATNLREEMERKLKSLSDKITEVSKSEKSTWQELDKDETKVAEYIAEVDRVSNRKVWSIFRL